MAKVGRGKQLFLLLWKNYTLKKRKKWVTIVEIIVPLFLFLLLAYARNARPGEDVEEQSYATQALPSAGLVPFIQSVYCGGLQNFDTTYNTSQAATLDQVLDVLERRNLSPARVLDILRNTTLDIEELNATIFDLGIQDQPGFSDIEDVLNDLEFADTANELDLNDNGVALLDNQEELRSNIRVLCDFIKTNFINNGLQVNGTDVSDLQELLTDFINITAILESEDPTEEFFTQWRGSDLFINNTVPTVLQNINSTFDAVTLTPANVVTVQNVLRDADARGANSTEVRDELTATFESFAGVPSFLVPSLVASLVGQSDAVTTADALQILSDTQGGIRVPQSPEPLLQEEIERLQRDLVEIQDVLDAIEEIRNLEGVLELEVAIVSGRTDEGLRLFICGPEDESSAPSDISLNRRRRDESDNSDGSTAVSTDNSAPVDTNTGGDGDSTSDVLGDFLSNAQIFFAPDVPAVRQVIQEANRTFDELATLVEIANCLSDVANVSNVGFLGDINLDVWVGFPDEDSMVAAGMGNENLDKVIGTVVFTLDEDGNIPKDNIDITIRMHEFKVPSTKKLQPRYKRDGAGESFNQLYSTFGFIYVQDMVERAVINIAAGRTVDYPQSFTQQFSVPSYRFDQFAQGISRTLPLFMVLAWIYTVSTIVKSIVYEKERRLKEAMKMMGLTNWVHWVGWFITSFVQMAATTFLLTLILSGLNVIEHANPVLLFLFLITFVVATISLAFAISVFFSKARLASACAGIIYFVLYLPFIFVSINEQEMSRTEKFLASLSSNTAFGIGASYISKYELSGEGLSFSNYKESPEVCDNFSFENAIWMLVLDAILYAVIAWYFEAVWPGEYGVPRPYYFPFQKSYWFGLSASKDGQSLLGRRRSTRASQRRLVDKDVIDEYDNETLEEAGGYREDEEAWVGMAADGHFEPPPKDMNKGIFVRGLVKVYDSGCFGKQDRRAVDELSLDMCQGQITSLLGHNGAGKTTTMSILTGLFPATEGYAEVNGYNIANEMENIRESLGICPQYNVLFDLLTVEEHLWFCSTLKGLERAQAEHDIDAYLEDIDLSEKRHVWSSRLSGGMKRKLSVAMAFIGGSKTVILDEPTAGMDPSARRKTWDLLLKYRKDRTIMLSTHHLDEADLLSDRIYIMAQGRLRCAGSPMFLKKAYGVGYTLTMHCEEGFDANDITAVVSKHDDGFACEEVAGNDLNFKLPSVCVAKFPTLFKAIEDEKDALKIKSYGVTATSLEEVFLKVADVAEDESEDAKGDGLYAQQIAAERAVLADDAKKAGDVEMVDYSTGVTAGTKFSGGIEGDHTESSNVSARHGGYIGRLVTGPKLWWHRYQAMFLKRYYNASRDRKAVLSQILLPAFFVLVGMIVATTFPPPDDLPKLGLEPSLLGQFCQGTSQDSYLNYANTDGRPLSRSLGAMFMAADYDQSTTQNLTADEQFLASNKNMTEYILRTYDELEASRRVMMTLEESRDPVVSLSSGLESGSIAGEVALAWYDNRHYHSLPISVGVLNNAVFRAVMDDPNVGITTSSFPLNKTADRKVEQYLRSGTDLSVAINVIIALSFVPASFVLFLVHERVTRAKHLQIVSGVDTHAYWLSNASWDFINYLIPAFICILVFLAFELPAYTGRNFGAVVLLIILYGWGVTPIMYCASWLFDVPATAYVVMITVNLFIGLTCTLTTFILELFPDDEELTNANEILRWVFLIFPNYCLGRGLMDLAKNEYIAQYYEFTANFVDSDRGYESPFKIEVVGRNMLFLFLEGVIFFLVALGIEHWKAYSFTKSSQKQADIARPIGEDDDVKAERRKVNELSSPDQTNDVMVIKNLAKTYQLKDKKQQKTAVRQLCVSVKDGECFGLLGVNGAGKTSTFKMLTGDTPVSSGDAWISGHSIKTQALQVFQDIGYCPQFDALNDLMTGRQTLTMYAQVRGIPKHHIKEVVDWTIAHMQLTRWADRVAKSYSGGNKRKLSVAIAMIGKAKVLLLDEPTTGMDPKARRFLWDLISGVVRAGRSVVLTSHSMEECEVLCQRLGIMVNGTFKCFGSPQHIRSKYGNGYSLILKVSGHPPDTTKVVEFVKSKFAGAALQECHNGYVRFQLAISTLPPLSEVFALLERYRHELNIEDYSVSQTSLDEIFCTFAGEQESEDFDEAQIYDNGEQQPSHEAVFVNPAFSVRQEEKQGEDSSLTVDDVHLDSLEDSEDGSPANPLNATDPTTSSPATSSIADGDDGGYIEVLSS